MSNKVKPSKNQVLDFCLKSVKQHEEWIQGFTMYYEQMEAARSYSLCKVVESIGFKEHTEQSLENSQDKCQIIAGPYFYNEDKKEFFKVKYLHEGWALSPREEGQKYIWYKGNIANPDLTFETEGNLTDKESFEKLRDHLKNNVILSC